MAVRFNGTDSYLSKGNLVTAVPYSVCFWARAFADTNATLFALAGAANHYVALNNGGGSNSLEVEADDAGGSGVAVSGVSLTDNDNWCFCILRGTSVSRKHVAIYSSSGPVGSDGMNTSITPTFTTALLGGTSGLNLGFSDGYFDGLIGEYYMLSGDIHSGMSVSSTDNGYIKTLALEGVWAMPHLRHLVVEYQSFRDSTSGMSSNESYFRSTSSAWVNNNGVIVDHHPPLSSSYRRPNDFTRNMIV